MAKNDISAKLRNLAIEIDVLEDMADRVLHEDDYLNEREELQLRLLRVREAANEIRDQMK